MTAITPVVQAVTTPELADRLYAFRYAVYVEEMRRPQAYADHTGRRVADPLDSTAHNIVACADGEVVGCIRVNLSRDGGLDVYETMLDMRSAGAAHPAATSLTTRLMVRADLRATSLAARLSQAAFTYGVAQGVRFNFIDCNDHLVGAFERLGYRRSHAAEHPDYGVVNAMWLDLHDVDHLRRVRSPFLRAIHHAA